MTRNKLVEAIARRIAKGEYGDQVDDVWHNYTDEANDVIDIALEAAAKEADDHGIDDDDLDDYLMGYNAAVKNIVTSIRKMMDPQHG